MVPVGASTLAWELRTPTTRARSQVSSHAARAASRMRPGASSSSMPATASRWRSSTPSMWSRLSAKPSKGPIRAASRVDVR